MLRNDDNLKGEAGVHPKMFYEAGPAAAPPHASSPRRTIAVVGSGRMGASAPRHPLPRGTPNLASNFQLLVSHLDTVMLVVPVLPAASTVLTVMVCAPVLTVTRDVFHV